MVWTPRHFPIIMISFLLSLWLSEMFLFNIFKVLFEMIGNIGLGCMATKFYLQYLVTSGCHDIRRIAFQHNDNQPKSSFARLSITTLCIKCHNAWCLFHWLKCWISLCWVSLCWTLLCWVSLCWTLLCWVSSYQLQCSLYSKPAFYVDVLSFSLKEFHTYLRWQRAGSTERKGDRQRYSNTTYTDGKTQCWMERWTDKQMDRQR
jgi:hypothetical protein